MNRAVSLAGVDLLAESRGWTLQLSSAKEVDDQVADESTVDSAPEEAEAVLAEWTELLDAGDTDALLRTAAERLLDIVDPAIASVSETITQPALDVTLVCRCAVKRAGDAAKAILALTESGFAYNALALLRPTCDDFFFVSFLRQLPRSEANRYIVEKARLEIEQGLLAQEEFFPKMRERFAREGEPARTDVIKRLEAGIGAQKNVLKKLGSNLSWGASAGPSAKHMAEQTDALPEYDFFYRGASSAVHASLHHLLRMVWGDPRTGVFSVSNATLEQYYARFATIYGFWLMDAVIAAAAPELPELSDALRSDAYGIWLATLVIPAIQPGGPGIVTEQELRWQGPPLEGA